jgi:hypothetical protein
VNKIQALGTTLPAIVMSFSLFIGTLAQATLGESASSIENDHSKFSGVRKSMTTTPHGAYSVQEMIVEGSTIREYVSSSNVVFAVVWNGHRHPDLSNLLGTYGADYDLAQKKTARVHGRRHLSLKSANPDRLVVEKWGQMSDVHGRAYSPKLVPTGVSLDDIK